MPACPLQTIKLKTPRSVAEQLKQQQEQQGVAAGQASSSSSGKEALPQEQQGQGEQQQQQQQQERPANGVITAVATQAAAGDPMSLTAAAAAAAIAAGKTDEELVEVERTVTVRADQSPILAALYRIQMVGLAPAGGQLEDSRGSGYKAGRGKRHPGAESVAGSMPEAASVCRLPPCPKPHPHPYPACLQDKAVDNVGRLLWLPLEIALLLTWHLAEEVRGAQACGLHGRLASPSAPTQGTLPLRCRCRTHQPTSPPPHPAHPPVLPQMLYRAIVLTWAAGWTIDRLYEAGADDTLNLLGLQLATPQAGAVLAAVGCTTVSLAILVQVGCVGHTLHD